MRRIVADQVALHRVSLFIRLRLIIGICFVNHMISNYIEL